MADRTDWKGKHAEAQARISSLELELKDALQKWASEMKRAELLEGDVEELSKRIGRAKIEGAKGLAEFLLESE